MSAQKIAGIDGASGTVIVNGLAIRSSITQQVVIPSGHSNRCLVVETFQERYNVTSVVWNGTEAFTVASDGTRIADQASANWTHVKLYILVAPSEGTHDVVITLDTAVQSAAVIYVLEGIDQSNPIRDVRKATGLSGLSSTLTHIGVLSGDLALDCINVDGNTHNIQVAGTSHIADIAYQEASGTSGRTGSNIDSNGTQGWSWSAGVGSEWSHVSVCFRAISDGGGGSQSTGEKYPTLGESVSENPWSDNTWVTPENIYADDAATANVTASQYDAPDQTYVLKATGFDFSSIPDGATIVGVTVRVNAWYRSGQGSGSIDLVQLLDTTKTRTGDNKASTPTALTTTNTTVITYGGAADLWGCALTPAWLKNSNFGVGLGILATAANADVDVNYITVEVEYIPPEAAVSENEEFFIFL